jgi:hypothetical protein
MFLDHRPRRLPDDTCGICTGGAPRRRHRRHQCHRDAKSSVSNSAAVAMASAQVAYFHLAKSLMLLIFRSARVVSVLRARGGHTCGCGAYCSIHKSNSKFHCKQPNSANMRPAAGGGWGRQQQRQQAQAWAGLPSTDNPSSQCPWQQTLRAFCTPPPPPHQKHILAHTHTHTHTLKHT